MAKIKKVGKGATIITLLSNPMVRRVVIKGATKAANSASNYLAARTDKKSPASPEGPGPVPASAPPSGSTAAPKTPSKPPSFSESAAVESIVASAASAAKPVAEKLAASPAGRSVLQAVNSITGQVLGGTDSPKRAGGSVASFVGNIIASQGAAQKSEAKSEKPKVKFTPVKPPDTSPPPVETMQWPPPKSNGSGS
jgi:hypothetical protein